MLSKSQIAEAVQEKLGDDFTKKDVTDVLNTLAQVVSEEIALGEDVKVPGVAKITFRYTKPRRKGEKYIGFGGEEMVADANRPAKIRMTAAPDGKLKNAVKEDIGNDKSKLFKAVAKAKG